jgi:hypothetical protein
MLNFKEISNTKILEVDKNAQNSTIFKDFPSYSNSGASIGKNYRFKKNRFFFGFLSVKSKIFKKWLEKFFVLLLCSLTQKIIEK